MRRALVAVALVGCLVVGPSLAAAAESFGFAVRQVPGRGVVVSIGDLDGRVIPPPVVAALAFVAGWAAGAPRDPAVPVTARGVAVGTVGTVRLVLPVTVFAVEAGSETAVVVAVGRIGVRTGTAVVAGSGTVELARVTAADPWVVTGVGVR